MKAILSTAIIAMRIFYLMGTADLTGNYAQAVSSHRKLIHVEDSAQHIHTVVLESLLLSAVMP